MKKVNIYACVPCSCIGIAEYTEKPEEHRCMLCGGFMEFSGVELFSAPLGENIAEQSDES